MGYFLFVSPKKNKETQIDNKKNKESAEIKKVEVPVSKESGDKKPVLPLLDLELSQSDNLVQEHLKFCSDHKIWHKWLGNKDLIQKFVAAVNSIAEGQSPVFTLQFLTPEKKFTTIIRGGKYYQDPRSFKRYNLFANVFSSLNAECCARLYQRLKPTIDKAFNQMGLERETFENLLKQAMEVILAAPSVSGTEILEKKVISYKFLDPKLEGLLQVQKHLLRMGPRNQKIIQNKIRELTAYFFKSEKNSGPDKIP